MNDRREHERGIREILRTAPDSPPNNEPVLSLIPGNPGIEVGGPPFDVGPQAAQRLLRFPVNHLLGGFLMEGPFWMILKASRRALLARGVQTLGAGQRWHTLHASRPPVPASGLAKDAIAKEDVPQTPPPRKRPVGGAAGGGRPGWVLVVALRMVMGMRMGMAVIVLNVIIFHGNNDCNDGDGDDDDGDVVLTVATEG